MLLATTLTSRKKNATTSGNPACANDKGLLIDDERSGDEILTVWHYQDLLNAAKDELGDRMTMTINPYGTLEGDHVDPSDWDLYMTERD
jgi:hypothetical protein